MTQKEINPLHQNIHMIVDDMKVGNGFYEKKQKPHPCPSP